VHGRAALDCNKKSDIPNKNIKWLGLSMGRSGKWALTCYVEHRLTNGG